MVSLKDAQKQWAQINKETGALLKNSNLSPERQKEIIDQLYLLRKCLDEIGMVKSISIINTMRRYFNIGKDKQYPVDTHFVDFLINRDFVIKGSVLDLGCGNGKILNFFEANGYKTVGIDINPSFITFNPKQDSHLGIIDFTPEKVIKLCKNNPNRNLDAITNIWESKYDNVISNLTLDRVRNPRQLINNVISLTKLNGRFLIGTLLPIINDSSQSSDEAITYTPKENRITDGKNESLDKMQICQLIENEFEQKVAVTKFEYKQVTPFSNYYLFTGIRR